MKFFEKGNNDKFINIFDFYLFNVSLNQMDITLKTNPIRGRPKKILSEEDRARREIANNKEKRRMREINRGIEELKKLLYENDHIYFKIRKVDVLRESVRFIEEMECKIAHYEEENESLKVSLNSLNNEK